MSNKYAESGGFTPRRDPYRQQSVLGPGKVSSDSISEGFDTVFKNLESQLPACQDSDVTLLSYLIVMLESIFDDYVRRIIHYRFCMIFKEPAIVRSFNDEKYKEFKVSLFEIAEKKSTLDESIGRIIKDELRYRSFQSYRNLVEGCSLVGIDASSFEEWERSVADIFEVRSQLVHHAGKNKEGKVTTVNKERLEKIFNTIKSVKDTIQKNVKELDKDYFRSELNNGNYQMNRIRE